MLFIKWQICEKKIVNMLSKHAQINILVHTKELSKRTDTGVY